MKKCILCLFVAFYLPGMAQSGQQANRDTAANNDLYITLHYADISPEDTFKLIYSHRVYKLGTILESDISLNARSFAAIASKKGTLTFHLKDIQPGYISIFKGASSVLLDSYFIEPGDNIDWIIDRDNASIFNSNQHELVYARDINSLRYKFHGQGQGKYNIRFSIDQNNISVSLYDIVNNQNLQDTDNYAITLDHGLRSSIAKLTSQRQELDQLAYQILMADITSSHYSHIFQELRLIIAAYGKDTTLIRRYCKAFSSYSSTLKDNNYPLSVELLSKDYCSYLLQKNISECQLRHIYDFKMDEVFIEIKSKYSHNEELRDNLLTMLFINYGRSFIHADSLLDEATAIIHSKESLEIFNRLREALSKGKPAYNFTLPDSRGKLVRLTDFKGKTVFVDFWYTGCGACRDYYQNVLSKVEDTLKNNKNIVFITISIDRKKETWLKSLAAGQYTSDHVINLYTAGKADDHDIIKHYFIQGYPHPMIIDHAGKMYQFQGKNLRIRKELIETLNQATRMSQDVANK